MIRTNDGGYALVGSTLFGSETHQDVFLVKTEPLEQIPQTTPIPTPATLEPTTTDNMGQTGQPSSNPTQTQPSSSLNTSGTSGETVSDGSGQDGTLIIIASCFNCCYLRYSVGSYMGEKKIRQIANLEN